MEETTVISMVEKALDILLKEDSYLLEHDVNERSITHKLAEYLQQMFSGYNVDCEYNRNGIDEYGDDLRKKLNIPMENSHDFADTEAKTVFPDIIIHRRGSNNNNLLVVEAKKSTSTRPDIHDKEKLEAFSYRYQNALLKKPSYRYQNALFVKFYTGINYDAELTWYKNSAWKEPYKLSEKKTGSGS